MYACFKHLVFTHLDIVSVLGSVCYVIWVPILWRVFIDSLLDKKNFEQNWLFLLCSWFCKVFVSHLNSIFFQKTGILLKIYEPTLSLHKKWDKLFSEGAFLCFLRDIHEYYDIVQKIKKYLVKAWNMNFPLKEDDTPLLNNLWCFHFHSRILHLQEPRHHSI